MNLWDRSNAAPHPLRTSKLQSVIATGVRFLASVTSGQMNSSASSHGLGSRLHVCLHSGAQPCRRQQLWASSVHGGSRPNQAAHAKPLLR